LGRPRGDESEKDEALGSPRSATPISNSAARTWKDDTVGVAAESFERDDVVDDTRTMMRPVLLVAVAC